MEVVRLHSRCTPPCCIAYRRAHLSINSRKNKRSPFFVSYLRESTAAVASTFSAQDQRRRQEFRRVLQKYDRPCIPPAMQSFRHIIGGLQGQPSAFLRVHHRLHRVGTLPTSEGVMPERRMVRRGATAEGERGCMAGYTNSFITNATVFPIPPRVLFIFIHFLQHPQVVSPVTNDSIAFDKTLS